MKLFKRTLTAFSITCVLVSCGGGSNPSSSGEIPVDDGNNLDTTILDILDQSSGGDPTTVRTDDISTGGYVGSTASVRNTVSVPENTEDHLWGIAVREGNDDLSVSANFGTFRSTRAFQEFITDFNRPLDSCHGTYASQISGLGEEFHPSFLTFSYASPGEVIPLLGSSGSLGEMVRVVTSYEAHGLDYTSYEADDLFDLSLSIPGDVFPAFDTATFPMAEPLLDFSAGGSPVGSNHSSSRANFNPAETASLQWVGGSDTNSYVHIEFHADFEETGNLENDYSVSIHCTLEDDGEFTFPQEVKDLYPREPASSWLTVVTRVSVKEITQPDATLLLLSSQKAN